MHTQFTARGGNAAALKQQNRAAVLRAILGLGPLSRRHICRQTGLTPSTITNIVGELIGAGFVRELGATIRPARVGRREILVDIVPSRAPVVGVHIGIQQVVLAVGDLRAKVLYRDQFLTQPERGHEWLLGRLASRIDALLRRAHVDRSSVLGLGLSTVGLVDAERGVLRASPGLGWTNLPLRDLVECAVGLPVVFDSDRRAMALAEMMFGAGRGARDFMLVHVGSTIKAGIVLDHRLYRGSTAAGGQIGHTVVAGADGTCACGRRGCLDTVASEEAIERRAQALADAEPGASAMREALAAREGPLRRRKLYRAAGAGDPFARRVLDEAGRSIGLTIANVLSVLDLELVILAGHAVEEYPAFVEVVRSQVDRHAFRDGVDRVKVIPSTFPADAAVVSGLALALHDRFYAPRFGPPSAVGRERAAG